MSATKAQAIDNDGIFCLSSVRGAAQGLVFIAEECFSEQRNRNNRSRNYGTFGLNVPPSWPESICPVSSSLTGRRRDRFAENTFKERCKPITVFRKGGRGESIFSGMWRITSTRKKCFGHREVVTA